MMNVRLTLDILKKKMWLYVSRDGKMYSCENAEKPQSDGVFKHYIANFHVVVRYCWSRETRELFSKDVDLLSRANIESSSLHTHQAHMNIGDGTWRLSSHAAHLDRISCLKRTFELILPPLPLELILQSWTILTRDSILITTFLHRLCHAHLSELALYVIET